jgi:glycine/D-amino acid oxidase-like deaminating enzyme
VSEVEPGQDDATLPGRAQVVVIGGSVIGCSVAHHLAKSGREAETPT